MFISSHAGDDPMVYEWNCIYNSPYHQHSVLDKNLLTILSRSVSFNDLCVYSTDDTMYDIELQCSNSCKISHRWTDIHNQGSQYCDVSTNSTEYDNNQPQKFYIDCIDCAVQASLKEVQLNFGKIRDI